MTCALTDDQQLKFYKKVFKDISELQKGNKDFSLENYLDNLHDFLISNKVDPELALSYIQLAPKTIMQLQSDEEEIGDYLADKGISLDALRSLVKSFKDDLVNVAAFVNRNISTTDEIKNTVDTIVKDSVDPLNPALPKPPMGNPTTVITPVKELTVSPFIPAKATQVFSTTGQQAKGKGKEEIKKNIPDPNKAFYYKFIEHLTPRMINYNEDGSLPYPGIDGGIFITAMASSNLTEDQLSITDKDEIESSPNKTEAYKNHSVVMVITNNKGEIVLFDNDYNAVEENGRPIYYMSRAIPKKSENGDYNLSFTPLAEPKTKEDYNAMQRDFKILESIKSYINKDRKSYFVKAKIESGSEGLVEKDWKRPTKVSDLNFDGDVFAPYTIGENRKGEPTKVYFKMNTAPKEVIELHKSKFTKDTAENIANLLVEDVFERDGAELIPVSLQRKIDKLKLYIEPRGVNGINLNSLTEDTIEIEGKIVNLKDKVNAKNTIIRFLTGGRINRQVDKSFTTGRTVIKETDPNYTDKLTPSVVFQSKEGKYYTITNERVNMTPQYLSTDVQDFYVSIEGDKFIYNLEDPQPYSEFIKKNTYVEYVPNAQGKIVALNGYISFQPLLEDLDKTQEVKIEEETKLTPKEQVEEIIANEESEIIPDDIDDILEQIRKANGLNKVAGQKSLNQKVTREQLVEAKTWYESHPMSKHIPFKTMFNIINTANHDSIATWTTNGITLFQGSDYSDLYHEAWHGFTQMFLTKEEKQKMYVETRKLSGNFKSHTGNYINFKDATDLQLEEYLAEEFRSYMLSGGKAKVSPGKRSIFKKILDILNSLFFGISVKDVILQESSIQKLQDIFENLRVGNINLQAFSARNSNFDVLNKGMEFLEDTSMGDSLSHEDSQMLVNAFDSLLSQITDMSNSGLNGAEMIQISELTNKEKLGTLTKEELSLLDTLRSKRTYAFTASVVTNEKVASRAYGYVKSMFEARRKALLEQLKTTSDPIEQERISDKVRILTAGIANFGDPNKPFVNPETKGLIAYHRKKSKYLSFQDKFMELDKMEEDQYKKGRGEFGSSGNELSVKENSRAETLYLLRSLHKIDKNTGKPTLDYLGFKELVDFGTTLNIVAKLCENTLSPYQIRDNIQRAIDTEGRLELKQLLEKLGPVYTVDGVALDMWTHITTDLANVRIKLVQMTLDETSAGYTFRSGETSSIFRQIGLNWEDQFQLVSNNPLIKRDSLGNYLDLNAVLLKYPTPPIDSYEFYKNIGINLSDQPLLKQLVNEPSSKYSSYYFYQQIRELKAAGIEVRSIKDLVQEHVLQDKTISSIGKRYNDLQQLELVFSDTAATSMVTNAEGNQQSEYSLNSTLSKMIIAINTVKSFAELMSMPDMQHLNPERNPLVRNSIFLNSLFDMNSEGMLKRPEAKLVLENLSGLQKVIDSTYADSGVASASADSASKLIMDFHMFLDKGMTEATRHSDKSTTYGIMLAKVISELAGLSKEGKYYIDLSSFLRDPETTRRSAGEHFIKYISDEFARIQMTKNMTKDDPARYVPVGKSTYHELGQKFQIFDTMLSQKTKDKLYTLNGIDDLYDAFKIADKALNPTKEQEKLRVLKSDIKKDVDRYFKNRVNIFTKAYDKSRYINLESVTRNMRTSLIRTYKISPKEANTILSKKSTSEKEAAAIEAYVYNSWIHNYETVVMFYGDPAQYNMAKEEFHKRNAAISSTGTFARTDAAMVNFVNTQLKNPYAQSQWYKNSGLEAPKFSYDGTINTAVLQDPVTRSIYIDQYKDIFMKDFGERNDKVKDPKKKLSKEELENKVDKMLEPYTKMEEGDAQGWITFDMYRIMLKSMGKWTRYQEDMYQDILSGKEVSKKKILQFFPVKKFQYFGPLLTSSTSLPLTGFHKFSLAPLIPSVIVGSPMETLHNRMTEQNIGYALFKSGSKVATITKEGTPDKFYNDPTDRTQGLAISEKDYRFTKNTIFVNYLKDQLETSPEFKEKVIFSTQLRKLIEEGLMEGGVASDFLPNSEMHERIAEWNKLSETQKLKKSHRYEILRRYEGHIEELVNIKKQEILDEVGGNMKGLLEMVKRELTKKEKAEHQIDFIEFDGTRNAPMHDLSMSMSADEIERMLIALVNKRIVRQKVNGEPFIQLSGAGYENTSFINKFDKATPEELKKYRGTNDLPTYNRDVKTGKTLAMKVKIALQGNFRELLNLTHKDGEKIKTRERLNEMLKDNVWLELGDHRKLITMVAVRIPVQGMNSMEFMEVYEFLPEEAGNVLIPPAEIVGKSGSDFDIDKLSTLMPAISNINGKVSLVKPMKVAESKKELKNKLSELSRSKSELDKSKKEAKENKKTFEAFKLTEEEQQLIKSINKEFRDPIQVAKDNVNNLLVQYGRRQYMKLTDQRSLDLEEMYYEAINELNYLENNRNLYISSIKNEKVQKFYRETEEARNKLIDEISVIKEKIDSLSGKAIENALIQDMREIMELPENFVSLIRPNSTDIFKDLAAKLAPSAKDFNIFESVHGEEKTTLSPTKIFEIEYNLYKHASNNVGKQTLGLGAIDNTFNTIFTRVGAYLEPNFISGKGKNAHNRRQTILLPSNVIKTDKGDAVSLSHIFDVDNNHRIADIISQLINGWVDVARDTWVFDIQGNKEVAPTLLLMVQAGVPVEQAVMFASQPLVKQYVEEQRLGKSLLSGPLGKKPSNFMFYRNEARNRIMDKYLPEHYKLDKKGQLKRRLYPQDIYNATIDLTKDLTEKDMSTESLYNNIESTKRAADQAANEGESYRYVPSQKELAMFLHYLEIEDMSKPVRDLKMRLNFDTSRSTSLFDAYSKDVLVDQLMEDNRIPRHIVERILDESPIGSFNIQKFVMNLFSPLFPLRTHEVLNKFILAKMREPEFLTAVKNTFGEGAAATETFISTFRDDLLSFIFQNEIAFSSDNLKFYKGLLVDDKIKTENVMSLKIGAFKKGDTLYIDRRTLTNQVEDNAYTKDSYGTYYNSTTGKYEGLGLAKVLPQTFTTNDEYFNFVLERETLRDKLTFDDIKTTDQYKTLFESLVASAARIKENEGIESEDHFIKRMQRTSYEMILRDKALDNIFNYRKMFFGSTKDNHGTFAEKLVNIKSGKEYSELEKQYPVIKSLVLAKGPKGMKNLKLSQRNPDSDTINTYHANIQKLANPSVIKVSDPNDNKEITEFFRVLPIFAFLQSGMNAKSIYNITKIVPTKLITDILDSSVKKVTSNLNNDFLQLYYNTFISQNRTRYSDPESGEYEYRAKKRVKQYQVNPELRNEVYIPTLAGKKVNYYNRELTLEDQEAALDIPKLHPLSPNTSSFNWVGVKKKELQKLVESNPDTFFLYETTQVPMKISPDDSLTDAVIAATATTNHIGIATKGSSYSGALSNMVILDSNFSENKRFIDEAITAIKEVQTGGQNIAFSARGYGQHLLGINLRDRSKDKTDYRSESMKTFLYLSERLYEEFGYINPNWLVQPESQIFLQSKQVITDEDVEEQLKKCFT